jgi:hypothetical protein
MEIAVGSKQSATIVKLCFSFQKTVRLWQQTTFVLVAFSSSLWSAHSGNPHNQLAVVASYTNNNLSAVHRYFRSLVCCYFRRFLRFLWAHFLSSGRSRPALCHCSSKFKTDLWQKQTKSCKDFRFWFGCLCKGNCLFSLLPFPLSHSFFSFSAFIFQEITDLKKLDVFLVKIYGMLYTWDDLASFEAVERAVILKLDDLLFRPMRERAKLFRFCAFLFSSLSFFCFGRHQLQLISFPFFL